MAPLLWAVGFQKNGRSGNSGRRRAGCMALTGSYPSAVKRYRNCGRSDREFTARAKLCSPQQHGLIRSVLPHSKHPRPFDNVCGEGWKTKGATSNDCARGRARELVGRFQVEPRLCSQSCSSTGLLWDLPRLPSRREFHRFSDASVADFSTSLSKKQQTTGKVTPNDNRKS